jgi:hypothetical protein
MVLILTPIVGGVGSDARADDTATPNGISRGAAGSAGLATNAGASCNGAAVPVRPEPPSLAAAQLASLHTVQRWADLIASAQPDDSDPALFAELTTVFPGIDIHSPDELSEGWGNLQAADVVWVRDDGSGAFVFGELVYDNASSKPCRTGFLCGRAEVDRGVIDSLALEAADGAIDESTVVTSRYPYVDGRWIAADDATSSGATVQARLVDLCNAAIPRADESRPAAGYTVQGTANAASSGGEEACQAQPNGGLPAGLVEGASVTIRDASSGEVIGTGTVSSTTFVQLTETTVDPPPWTCTFNITATLSSTPESITVQVGELAPLGPTSLGGSGGFSVSVPDGTGGTELQPAVDTTAADTTAADTTAADTTAADSTADDAHTSVGS